MDIWSINWLAVVVCVASSMLSGMLWYNPQTFFLIWWKGIGKTDAHIPGSSKGMGVTWTLTVLSSAVQAVFMAVAVNVAAETFGGPSLFSGALVGFLVWLGVVAPTYMVNNVFAGFGLKIWAIEAGNHLVNYLVFGAVLGAWRL